MHTHTHTHTHTHIVMVWLHKRVPVEWQWHRTANFHKHSGWEQWENIRIIRELWKNTHKALLHPPMSHEMWWNVKWKNVSSNSIRISVHFPCKTILWWYQMVMQRCFMCHCAEWLPYSWCFKVFQRLFSFFSLWEKRSLLCAHVKSRGHFCDVISYFVLASCMSIICQWLWFGGYTLPSKSLETP